MEDLLPEELMIDILSRLPVKTIIHCKCVCKKWRNLLMESSFVHLHHSRSPTGLIIHHKTTNIHDPGILEWVEIQDKDDYHHLHHDPLMSLDLNLAPILQKSMINLIGSVNGLICLWQDYPNHDNIYICNPVTREYMILPRQQQYYGGHYPTIIYGIGVSSMTGEYKVIGTFQRCHERASEAQVYTLGTGQWRSLGPVPYEIDVYPDGSFLNDHYHWIVCDKKHTPEKLCTFDFDKETTFQLFPSPPPVDSEYHYECLTILKGCLCKMDSYDFQFTIWVMKEYGIKESWHKELVINQAICPHLDWLLFQPSHMIEVLKDGSILTLRAGKLWAFYPKNLTVEDTGEYKVIRVFRRRKCKLSGLEAEVYTLGTGKWRSIGRAPFEFYGYYDGSSEDYGSFLNGHCHWIVSDKEDVPEKLCTFDLDKETFELFPSPSVQGSTYHPEHLAILKGCLCIMDFDEAIWVMKEYGIKESWHKVVVINQAISPHLDWPICEPLFLIEGLKDGSILMVCRSKLWVFYP